MKGIILLAAGGTGGHLFPAHALSVELKKRGWDIDLVTDERAMNYGSRFPARQIHIVSSATFSSRSPLAFVKAGFVLLRGLLQSFHLLYKTKPCVVIGFGGYPTVPPLFAAVTMRVPTALQEQNAVAGRANRLLAPYITTIATGFEAVQGFEGVEEKILVTGNPVRDGVLQARHTHFRLPIGKEPFRLLVFGGSQGARFLSDIVPAAVIAMPEAARRRIVITQQCRAEDIARVRAAYDALGVKADLGSFFVDIPEHMAQAHLIICRSGASTVAELAVIGRPSFLIPFPHALDNDQKCNALSLEKAGGAYVFDQENLTAERLAEQISEFIKNPGKLVLMAKAARDIGKSDAVERLACLVESIASKGSTHDGNGDVK